MSISTTTAIEDDDNDNSSEMDVTLFVVIILVLIITLALAAFWIYRRCEYVRRRELNGANSNDGTQRLIEHDTPLSNPNDVNIINNKSDTLRSDISNSNDSVETHSKTYTPVSIPMNNIDEHSEDDSHTKIKIPTEADMIKLSTAYDDSIVHNVVNMPGVTVRYVSGNIVNDINAIWDETIILACNENGKNKLTYKDAIMKDANFGARERVLTRRNTNYQPESDPETTKAVDSNDELVKYGLLFKENSWKSRDYAIVGANLINRLWYHHFENVPKSDLSLKKGFTIMQFNMLADGLSGGYLDTSMSTMESKNIDIKTWEDKLEKSFLLVNPLCLQWRFRGLRLIEEILRYKCDIVCVEECDQANWMYNCYMKHYGYNMIFQEKTDSPCRYVTDNYVNSAKKVEFEVENERFLDTMEKVRKNIKDESVIDNWKIQNDGCCVFYNKERFKIVSKNVRQLKTKDNIANWMSDRNSNKNIELSIQSSGKFDLIDGTKPIYDKNDSNKLIGFEKLQVYDKKKSKKEGKDVYKTPSVATTFIALHMMDIVLNREFILVVTHLKSSKDYSGEMMRLGQLEAMLGYGPYRDIDENKDNNDNNDNIMRPLIYNPNNLPILMCCDMNAKSHDTLKYDSKLDKKVKDYGFECYQRITNNIDNNGLGFISMYKLALNNKEPIYTTWKERINLQEDKKDNDKTGEIAKHTIDYIFSKGNEWTITHHLDIPDSSKDIGKALLPDWHYPSDHFSLAMRLEWKI